jgi:hypothetical protein
MKLTSAQAAKLIKKMNEEYNALIKKERLSSTFLAASGEDPESLRPEYDYAETQEKLDLLEKKIRTGRHALNVVNSTHTVPGFDMTVDQILVYIPQLTARVSKLSEMKSKLPKMRVEDRYGKSSNIIDYTYVNYDLKKVESDFEKASDELSKAQIALDTLNTTEVFDIDI